MENPNSSPESGISAFSARIVGRVQGVGFRWNAVTMAERLGVVGWVRNESDGSVRCWCEGRADVLEKYLDWLKRGPPGAAIEKVSVARTVPTGSFDDFRVQF